IDGVTLLGDLDIDFLLLHVERSEADALSGAARAREALALIFAGERQVGEECRGAEHAEAQNANHEEQRRLTTAEAFLTTAHPPETAGDQTHGEGRARHDRMARGG